MRAERALHRAVAQPALPTALSRCGSGEPVFSRRGTPFAQTLAGQFDPISVVNDTIEDGVGERGNPDQVMPSVHGNLAGDDERALVVAIFDDFQKIARLSGGERLRPQSSRISNLTRERERRSLA